jgi:hypothetical protein
MFSLIRRKMLASENLMWIAGSWPQRSNRISRMISSPVWYLNSAFQQMTPLDQQECLVHAENDVLIFLYIKNRRLSRL